MQRKKIIKDHIDERRLNQLILYMSDTTLQKLEDIHRCLELDQTVAQLAADLFERAIAKDHKDMPTYTL